MNKAERYYGLFDAASRYAGVADEDWNARFRKGLEINGLTLASEMTTGEYPTTFPWQAPEPFGDKDAWPIVSYIVWRTQG